MAARIRHPSTGKDVHYSTFTKYIKFESSFQLSASSGTRKINAHHVLMDFSCGCFKLANLAYIGRTQIDLEPFQFLLKAESSYKIYIVIDNTKMHMSP